MFEQSMIPKGKKKVFSTVAAIVGQLAVVAIIVLIPLVYVQALPSAALVATLVAPPPPAPPPPPPPPAAVAAVHRPTPVVVRKFDPNTLVEPTKVPKQTPVIQDADISAEAPAAAPAGVPGGVAGGVPGGVAGGVQGGVLGSIMNSAPSPVPPPPPPPKAAPAPTPQVVHVGGNVQAAMLISAPKPVYPALAKQAGVQGTVELKAVISKDGHVQNLTVASGNPLLVNAAVTAVRQWVYKPTILNGQPVQVATEIQVHFQLG